MARSPLDPDFRTKGKLSKPKPAKGGYEFYCPNGERILRSTREESWIAYKIAKKMNGGF